MVSVIFAILFLTWVFGVSSHLLLEDPKIFQVTDDKNSVKSNGPDWLSMNFPERDFQLFMRKYNKKYQTREEYIHRLGIFAKNKIRAVQNQVLDPSAVHGITPFSDLSEEEFETFFMGLKGGFHSKEETVYSQDGKAFLVEEKSFPENFDWRENGAVTHVKLQGTCGSCWAFSTTGVIEGANFISTGKLLTLSEQQLIDCDHKCDAEDQSTCDNGCHGGLMTNAYKYLMEAGGLEEESSYPYTGTPSTCKFKPEKAVVRLVNFTNVPLEENQIIDNLVHRGPLAVGLNAAFMQTYIGGVSCPLICGKRRVNHGVLLVGYGSKGFSLLRLGYRPYWIIKNSWGKQWGDKGYYHLCRGHNMCGINTMVSAVTTTS
ncbi:papain family cysteine protease isoform X1 [Tasmannia lanceolata]|uniref:papain family cysteine protease isoform X1 n=1 Tax=Tasmannia lanceolata TaxID=3420 RepID=UPI0040640723